MTEAVAPTPEMLMTTPDSTDTATNRRAWSSRVWTWLEQEFKADAAHDLGHIRRVLDNAQTIAFTEQDADLDVVLAAVLLHDAVNLPKNHPERSRASRLSAEVATTLLREFGFPEEKLPAVAHAIEAHSFSANIETRTIEAKIVQDADRIDSLGHIGIARCFAVSGALGRPLWHPTDPLAASRPLDDQAWALDHFGVKLATLPGTMKTTRGEEIAWERWDIMDEFRRNVAEDCQAGPSIEDAVSTIEDWSIYR